MGIAERQTSSIDLKLYKDQAIPKHPPSLQSSNSFEHTYKTSYSHGLEKIYALENIDISTVKMLDNDSSGQNFSGSEELSNRWIDSPSCQIEFDLGSHFKGYIEPFFLREPIQMLGLSKRIETSLIANGQKQIQDLLSIDLSVEKWPQNIGQGHIDEIHDKLKQYLEGASIQQAKSINFLSWLKILTFDLTPKKIAATFEYFNIPHSVSLSSFDTQELRRTTQTNKLEWIKESKQESLSKRQASKIDEDLKKITKVFIIPWMEKRFNVASKQEIIERLIYIAEPCCSPTEVLNWMTETYFDGKFILSDFLEPLDDGLYGTNKEIAAAYNTVIKTALSYFYKGNNSYPLDTLISWISKEFIRKWEEFPHLLIERILKLSPHFRVRKDKTGKLSVKLS